ncbi:diguanylate cyclase [Shewanella sp. YIC-542]|uniref:diguanylate cyclase n=1 Tax=Shewanella mytili TaxID=3377111 RepID=UPI00398EA6CD
MRNYWRVKRNVIWGFLALLYFAATYEVVEYQQRSYSHDMAEDRADDLSRQLALMRYRLEASVMSEIFQVNALASYIAVRPHSTPEQWRTLAINIRHKARHVRNITVAPDDVIRFVYPLKGNEKALGLDFQKLPQQQRSVQLARELQAAVVAGPLTLVQGGEAIIVRIPIFVDPPNNRDYWGFCSMVLDWPQLLLDAGSNSFPTDVALAMRGVDGQGAKGAVFYGDPWVFAKPLRTETVNLLGGSWQLGIRMQPGQQLSNWWHANVVRLLGYALSAAVFMAFMQLLNAYRNAHRYSYEDVLTKSHNRRRAMLLLEKLQKHGSHFCIVSIDLDHFKLINDTYGHMAGDALLIEVAARLERTLRGSDMVARIGGDEFLLILPRITDKAGIVAMKAKIQEQVCAPAFIWRGIALPVDLSLGYACYPADAHTIEELLHVADRAMYMEKKRQRQENISAQEAD